MSRRTPAAASPERTDRPVLLFLYPEPVAWQVAAHRRRVRETFSDLIGGTGGDPGLLAVIVALYDGAMSAAYLDREPTIVAHARCGAEQLLRRHDGP